MSIDHKRRSRLAGLSARHQSWALEDYKDVSRQAAQALLSAEQSRNAVENRISETELYLSDALSGALELDLTAIQSTRVYIQGQYEEHQRCVSDQRQAAHRAEQADIQLRHAALAVRALERVKAKSDQEVSRVAEARVLEENVELWLQRVTDGDER